MEPMILRCRVIGFYRDNGKENRSCFVIIRLSGLGFSELRLFLLITQSRGRSTSIACRFAPD